MQPIPHGPLSAVCAHILGDFTLVMRKLEVHATAVDVECLAEVFGAHDRAFEVPSWEAFAPRGWPTHQVARIRFLPQGEIQGVPLLILTVQGPGLVLQLIDAPTTQCPVIMAFREFPDVEIDASIGFIGEAIVDDVSNHADLLHDVARSRGFDGGRKDAEDPHDVVEVVGVALDHLHGLEVL